MKRASCLSVALAAGTTMMVGSSASIAQEVVYDNTTNLLPNLLGQVQTGASTGFEAGDQITLGGVGRVITQFTAYPYNLGTANTGTVVVRFYDTPGSGANPGVSTVLWDSGPVVMAFPAGQEALAVAVPNITVPNTFVWTATFTFDVANSNAFGARMYNPPTVGTSDNFFWAKDAFFPPATNFPGWAQLVFGGATPPVANFGAKLTAVNTTVNGACCLIDGTCTDTTNILCAAIPGAIFQGAATTCGTTTCAATGACCLSGGACSSIVETYCASQGGVFGGVGVTCAAANCPKLYFYDDGTGENAVGAAAAGGAAYANQFVSVARAETITQIQIAFGTPATLDGTAVTAYLWSDPNGDGSPADALVLAEVPGVIAGANANVPIPTPTWVVFDIPDTVVPAGQKFFVGFVFQNEPVGVFPGAIDTNAVQGKSWFGYIAGTFDPNAWAGSVELTAAGLPGDWLIRADAIGSGSVCYPNCDSSTVQPCLNVQDFGCFLNKFASADPYANCDNSTTAPVLNVQDFGCFLNKFASGCSSC